MKHLPKIVIDTIPHKKHRYPTVGDYYYKNKVLNFRVSQMHPDHEFLVLIHELVEWYLTQKHGITLEQIDAFDKMFEARREQGNTDEPGDDPKAPYTYEHSFATLIERAVAKELGVNWAKYDSHVNSL